MATDISVELDAFNQFVREQLKNNGAGLSLEESVQAFREYQHQLDNLRAKLREAGASSARGESAPLDIEQTISKGRERLAAEGILD